MFDWIAVIRAEMPKAVAMRNEKTAPKRIRSPRSWQALSNASPETSSCPPTDSHPVIPKARRKVLAAMVIPLVPRGSLD